MNIKSIPYEAIPVHLLKNGGEQNSELYSKLNPSKQVPCLTDGKFSIGQSMAILEYLEEIFPAPALLPSNKVERAHVRQICEVVNSGLQPLQNLSVVQFLTGPLKLSEDQKNMWLQHWISRGLESLESLLQKHSGTYSFGNQITMADCLLVPQIFSSQRFKVDLTPYPKAREIYDRCLQLTDFIKASPEKQPDFES